MKAKPGFTLLELLLTLSLFAGLMGLLLNSFFQFQLGRSQVEERLALRQEARALERLLTQDLLRATYLSRWMVDQQQKGLRSGLWAIDEAGKDYPRDRLYLQVRGPARFFPQLPAALDPGLHEVGYEIKEGLKGELSLVRRESYYIDAEMDQGDQDPQHVLSHRVVGLDLKFHRPGLEPVESWDPKETKSLPPGVEVHLWLKDQKGRVEARSFQVNLRPSLGSRVDWGI